MHNSIELKKRKMAVDKKIIEKAKLWLGSGFDEETRNYVKSLFDNDLNKLEDAFYKDLEFGTGGLRGVMGVGTNRMNKYTVGMTTQGLTNYLKKSFKKEEIKVAIAFDCRNSSDYFAEIAANVLSANGIKVYLFDKLRPTPLLSFVIRHLKCQSGIVITASHNPKEYNGYKVYWEDGGQLVEPHDKNVINEVKNIKSVEDVNFNKNANNIIIVGEELDNVYLQKIKTLVLSPEHISKYKNLKIVFTPIHGATVDLGPKGLKSYGFENIIKVDKQNIPDGNFPTVESPNPEEPKALEMALNKAKENNADLVMGTDPDGDRVGIIVKNLKNEYVFLNGNQTASLLIYYLLKQYQEKNLFKGNEYIIKTIVTTDLINKMAESFGVDCYETLTGFKHIAAVMREFEGEKKFIAGGEESYGYLVGDFVRDKDAIISCCVIAEAAAWAKSQNKTLFEILWDIYTEFGFYKDKLISITKKGKKGHEEIQQMMNDFRSNTPEEICGIKVLEIIDYSSLKRKILKNGTTFDVNQPKSNVLQFILSDGSKITMRPSGTEPKIKFYFSAKGILSKPDNYYITEKELQNKIEDIVKELNIK